MFSTSQFNAPEEHPWQMLEGYEHPIEKEQTLAFILSRCVKVGGFVPVKCLMRHSDMVEDGLLLEQGGTVYSLTEKSKELLLKYYGKEAICP